MGTSFLFFATVSLLLCSMPSINLSKAMAAVLNINTDQSSLLAFKDHISSHEILANNWSTTTSVCNWIGVTCGSSHHRVTALNLSYMDLVGTIPPHLGNLSFLAELDLRNNSFQGSLPNELARLRRLKLFSLRYNNLTGEIPTWLASFPKLEVLSLGYNSFTGVIPSILFNVTTLQILSLSGNMLSGFLPPNIFMAPNLQFLATEYNQISGSIPPVILNNSSLQTIAFTNNHLSGELPQNIFHHLPNLKVLGLSWNNFVGELSLMSLFNCKQLQVLSLSFNNFTGNIPAKIGNLTILNEVYLGDNSLQVDPSDPELSIIDSLAACKYLRRLELSSNPLNSMLPISIGNLSNSLEFLELDMCNLRATIPSNVGNLSGLTELALSHNQFTGTLTTGIQKLKKLQKFDLEDNKLEGLVPHEICQLKSLGILSLSSNRFSGPIPSCLGNLTSLRELWLTSNTFNLTIPSTLWSLSDLLLLALASNELSGTLPSEISNLKVVMELYLDNNKFLGRIPSSIGGLQHVTNLSLAQNELEGSIPESFGSLVSLEYLDLSKNNLTGVIPKSLEALVDLNFFNVSFNKLEGQIPTGGHFANFSAQSFMGNENLCGSAHFGYLECKATTSSKISKSTAIVLKYILPVTTATVIILIFTYVLIKCKKHSKLPTLDVESAVAMWRRISHHELQQATNGFSDVNLLGIGSFGKVYKAILSDGLNVAVKVFNLDQEGAFMSFDAECEVFCNIRHRNLIKIISSCSNIDFKALVLSYMSNGSLEKWLHSHNHSLSLIQRLNIMIGVAAALDYLHHGCTIPIVHCDLKPSNVLLDDDMVAHVTDFGIAKLLGGGDSITQTMTLATMGYMAPEYGLTGTVSKGGDVYSYGILIMETFTQKKPTDEMFQGELNIINWVKQSYLDDVTDIVDARLLIEEEGHFAIRKSCLSSIMGLALDCSMESPQERTNMQDVLIALKKIKVKFLNETRNPRM